MRPLVPTQPYKPFFLLAALDAMLSVAVWLPWTVLERGLPGMDPAAWHRNALLFGTLPAILAGFLLTALPRWTGRPAPAPRLTAGLAALWLSARAAQLVSTTAGLALSAAFVLILSLVAAIDILAARDRRDYKVIALLGAFCSGIVLTAAGFVPWGYRLAVACLLGLVMVIGGRVTPALTAAFLVARGKSVSIARSRLVEVLVAVVTAAALLSWVIAPSHPAAGLLGIAAAATQAFRLSQWRGWRCVEPAVAALHVGYAWLPLGFAMLALHVLRPATIAQAAALHAWMVGAIGTMSLAIMASMIRRHSGRPFARSPAMIAALLMITASTALRIAEGWTPAARSVLIGSSAACWIAAFALFLWAFRDVLLWLRRPVRP